MVANESHAISSTADHTSDRYCRHCTEIALVYDPSANCARCRACGELAYKDSMGRPSARQ